MKTTDRGFETRWAWLWLAWLALPMVAGGVVPGIVAAEPPATFDARAAAAHPRTLTVENGNTARWTEVRRKRVGPELDSWRLRWRDREDPSQEPASPTIALVEHQVDSALALPPLTTEPLSSDPFADPFGDSTAPVALQPPGEAEVPRVQPAPAEDLSQPPVADEPCDRIYNNRDCCAEGAACQHALDLVRSRSIRNISLDVSPQFTKGLTNGESGTYEQVQEVELAQSPVRLWRDRAGRVVADGQLRDFRHGHVIIAGTDGQTVRVPFTDLSEDDSCFVTAWWSIPAECSLGEQMAARRDWVPSTLTWKASALCHKPLYFEDVRLERYGHSAGPFVQPALSGAHFFLNLATLPYQVGISPPNECEYPLGYYRPGSCAPWLVPAAPISLRGALLQAGAITGGVSALP